MARLRDFSLASRIYRLSGTVILVYLLVIGWLFLEFRHGLYEAHRQEVRHLVEAGCQVLDLYDQRVKAGTLSAEKGRQQALEVLRSLRFAGDNYFWINDLTPMMILHPSQPELEGESLADYRDASGRLLFTEMAKEVRHDGAGYIQYLWPRPGEKEPTAKISYIKVFPAWEWMIGAGFHTDRIDRSLAQLLLCAGGVLGLVTSGAVLLVTCVTRSITEPMAEAVTMIEALEKGDLEHRLHLDQKDEVGRLGRVMDAFADNLQYEILTAFDHLARGDFSFKAKGLIREPLARTNALLNSLIADLDNAMATAWTEKSKVEGLITAMGDGVAILDAQLRVIYQNPIHIQQVGNRLGELCFHADKGSEGGCATCTVRQALARGGVHRMERRLLVEGRELFIEATASPVRNEAGELVALIEIARDITDRKQAEKRVEYLAFHDPLTGLANRALFEDRLQLALAAAQRHQESGALMFLDLDRFKTVNDSLGHHIGDLLLQEAAGRLQTLVRATDTVCRSGGDEFILLLPGLATAGDAAQLAEKILVSLSRPYLLEEREVFISASIGISFFPEDGTDFDTLSRNADAAMYQAKEQGRNTFQFSRPELATGARNRRTS